MSSYYKREITYDPKTQLYTTSVPELGIEVKTDTEMSGIMEIRKEVQEAARRPKPLQPAVLAPEGWAVTAPPGSSYVPQSHPASLPIGIAGSKYGIWF